MALSITHSYVSPVVDDGVSSEVGPNEWNEAHTILGQIDSTQIAGDAIVTSKIADASVTFAKIQDASTGSVLLGRRAGSGGDFEEITLGTNMVMTGTVLSSVQSGAVLADGDYGDVVVSVSGTTITIDAGVVTSTKIATGGVVAGNIAANTITSTQIADDAITAGELAPSAVTSTELAADAVNSSHIVTGGVTSAELGTDAVTSVKILAGAVISTKLGSDAVVTVKILDSNVTSTKIVDGGVIEAKIATDAVTSTKIKDGAVITAKIAAQAVTSTEIKLLGVTAAQIANDTITSTQIATDGVASNEILAGAVVNAKLATDAVTSTKIIDGGVSNAKLATDAVTSTKIIDGGVSNAKLATNAVTSTKIIDAGVTYAKIQDISVGSVLLGRDTSGAGDVQEISLGAGLAMVGSVLTNTVSSSSAAAAGDSGEVQFNDGDVLAADPGLTFSSTSNILGVSGTVKINQTGDFSPFGATGRLQMASIDEWGIVFSRFKAGANAAAPMAFVKSRTDTVGSNVILQADDEIGNIAFFGADGVDYNSEAARINVIVDGTPGAGDMPGRISFATTPDGAESPVERFRIKSNGTFSFHANSVGAIWSTPASGDALWGWDNSASTYTNMTVGTILTEGTPASGDFFLMYGAEGDIRKVDFDDMPGGSLADGDKGDIVVSTSGSVWTIDAGVVESTKIAAGGVATGNIATGAVTSTQLATDAVSTVKILAGAVISTKLGTDAVTTIKILDSNVTSTKIVDGGVIEAKIATDAVTSTKIKDGAVITAKIAAQAVTSTEIKLLGVTAAQIANDTITSTQVAADAITASEIAADAVTSSEIKDAAVIYAKIQDASGSTLIGRRAGSSGDVEEITLGTGLAMVGSVLTNTGAAAAGGQTLFELTYGMP